MGGVEYDTTVAPTAILVHENLGPGAVRRVSHYPKFGIERTLRKGIDPMPNSAVSGVSRLPVTPGFSTNRIKIYIDSPAVPGWNEIDAVGFEYGNKKVIWAARATASSSYGVCSSRAINNGFAQTW